MAAKCFAEVNHLANRTVPHALKAFKEVHQFFISPTRFLHHTVAHVDGKFVPVKILIESMLGGPTVNLASANERVPEIERRIWAVKERSRSSRHDLPFQRIPE